MVKFEVPEGATPIEDDGSLRIKGLTTHAELSAAEAENILQALRVHLGRRKNPKRRWFTEDFVRRVHRAMYGEVWTWAGEYRKTQTNVGVQAHMIADEIGKLCGDVWYWDSNPACDIPIPERAVRIHHRLVYIHPFLNGNGRHARLMADVYLHSHGLKLPQWPVDIGQNGEIRKTYIDSLRAADRGDIRPLTDYTKTYMEPV